MRGHKKFLALSHIVLIVVSVLALLPFWLLVMASFSDESTAVKNGYRLIPQKWSLAAYQYLAGKWQMFGRAYLITIVVTVIGVVVCVLITLMFSYMLSRPGLPGGRVLSFYVIFTMLFNGGLVATYIMYSQTFHIKNTLFALILPSLLTNAFFITMVRNFLPAISPWNCWKRPKSTAARSMAFSLGWQCPCPSRSLPPWGFLWESITGMTGRTVCITWTTPGCTVFRMY